MTINQSLSFNSSSSSKFYYCKSSEMFLFTSVFIITRSVFVFPFSVWVLYLGHQRRRQQRSVQTMSHSDVITYNMAVMHLFEGPGVAMYLLGFLLPQLAGVGFCISSLTVVGEILFHLLTCVERYLAVVHPLTYLKLKTSTGVMIRNICVGFIWLFSLGWSCQITLCYPYIPFVQFFCISAFTFAAVSFFSLSVLCILIRPRPEELGGGRVDPTKKKAFNTIVIITGALWLLFFGYFALQVLAFLSDSDWCFVVIFTVWLSLPSSMVVPFLFLYRAEKLTCCCASTEENIPSVKAEN